MGGLEFPACECYSAHSHDSIGLEMIILPASSHPLVSLLCAQFITLNSSSDCMVVILGRRSSTKNSELAVFQHDVKKSDAGA